MPQLLPLSLFCMYILLPQQGIADADECLYAAVGSSSRALLTPVLEGSGYC